MCITILNKHHGNPDGVYIGRGSIFGNPYPINQHNCRDAVCDKYEHHFLYKINHDPTFKIAADKLVTKARKGNLNLVCFCAPQRCHGETIKRYVEQELAKPEEKTMFRIVIAGSRDFDNYQLLEQTVRQFAADNNLQENDVGIVSGKARGADRLGEQIAREYKLHLDEYPAEWDKYGKRAGYLRNEQMADVANAALIFWDGESPGTKHMIDICKRKGVHTQVIEYAPRITTYNGDSPPWLGN